MIVCSRLKSGYVVGSVHIVKRGRFWVVFHNFEGHNMTCEGDRVDAFLKFIVNRNSDESIPRARGIDSSESRLTINLRNAEWFVANLLHVIGRVNCCS